MSDAPSSPGARSGILAIVYVRESAWEARVAEALTAYAATPIPSADQPIDTVLADLGAKLFRKRCSACHTIHGEDKVGPDLAGVTRRRTFSFIEGMILSPDSMTQNDADARDLKEEFVVQMMTPRYFEVPHARAIVEFLRQVDGRSAPGS
jgi:cytochrome c